MPTNPKRGEVLVEHYIKVYKKYHKEPPRINRNKKIWGFADMAADLTQKDSIKVIDYLFENYDSGHHDVDYLLSSYDVLYEKMKDDIKGQEYQNEVIRKTKERAERFVAKRAQSNRSGD